jgi:predicted RNA-binding Zn-ribbon protein involved in translation (DUF1610 family)
MKPTEQPTVVIELPSRRHECPTCGREAIVRPRPIAFGVVAFDQPHCARCAGYPPMQPVAR